MGGSVVWIRDPAGDSKPVQSFEDGITRFNQSQLSERAPSSNLRAFGERLQAYIESNRVVFEGEEGVINDFWRRLAADVAECKRAVYPLKMPYEETVQLRLKRIVMEIASDLGLMLFDEDIGLILSPGCKMFPAEKEELWKGLMESLDILDSDEFPAALSGFSRLAEPVLEMMMLRYGFIRFGASDNNCQNQNNNVIYQGYYQNVSKLGEQWVGIFLHTKEGKFVVSVSLIVAYDCIESVCRHVGFPEATGGILISYSPNDRTQPYANGYSPEEYYLIGGKKSFCEYLAVLKGWLSQVLSMAGDVKGLDELLNGGGVYPMIKHTAHKHAMPPCLVVARLANNPEFDALTVSLIKNSHPIFRLNRRFQEAWPKLVNYLRDEIKPLV